MDLASPSNKFEEFALIASLQSCNLSEGSYVIGTIYDYKKKKYFSTNSGNDLTLNFQPQIGAMENHYGYIQNFKGNWTINVFPFNMFMPGSFVCEKI